MAALPIANAAPSLLHRCQSYDHGYWAGHLFTTGTSTSQFAPTVSPNVSETSLLGHRKCHGLALHPPSSKSKCAGHGIESHVALSPCWRRSRIVVFWFCCRNAAIIPSPVGNSPMRHIAASVVAAATHVKAPRKQQLFSDSLRLRARVIRIGIRAFPHVFRLIGAPRPFGG